MARYGLDYYSASSFPLSYYGSDNPLNYDASPVTALPSGYQQITLTWVSPVGPWVNLRIIRSPLGYPVNVTDGIKVFETFRRSDPQLYTDTTPKSISKVYFYSIFVYDSTQLTWYLAGRAKAMAVKNYGTGDQLYDYMPRVYKLTTPYVPSEASDNNDLKNFLALFGFDLDLTRAYAELITDRYNFETITAETIPLLLNQFGLRYEPEIGYQNARVLVRDSVQLTKEKGSKQGLREYIKGFTGWACPKPITGTPNPTVEGLYIGPNMMLDFNDSSFEQGVGNWVPDSTASISTCNTETIISYLINNQYIRLNFATAHGYKVGDKVTMAGWETINRLNVGNWTIAGIGDKYIEVLLSGAPDIAVQSAYNNTTFSYPVVTPYPAPYYEPTSLALYPNKQSGILSIANNTGTAQAISAICGGQSPITKGVPTTAGNYYTFSAYSAALSTPRSLTVGINWYDRFGVYMKTTTGSPVTNATGAMSTRAYVTDRAPTNIYFNSFVGNAGSGYTDGAYTNVPLTYVSGKQFSTAPLANISILGGAVQSVAVVNGGKGSDTTTRFTLNKADIGSPSGSGLLLTVNRVQESYYAAPVITVSNVGNAASGERHYFDACQFESGQNANAFDDARQVHITLKANRINELTNPTFYNINSIAPWSFTNASASVSSQISNPTEDVYNLEGYQQTGTTVTITLTTVHPYKAGDTLIVSGLPAGKGGYVTVSGVTDFTIDYTIVGSATVSFTTLSGTIVKTGNALVLTKTGSGNVDVVSATNNTQYMGIYYPSTYYNFSVYAKGSNTTTASVIPSILWYDSTKTLISESIGTATSLSSVDTWVRPSFAALAPATAAYAVAKLRWTSASGAVNDIINLDAALFENSNIALDYFDGSSGFTNSSELFWEGQAPNAARSHYYRNRVAIADRLVKGALDEWIMGGSTYAIYLAQPQT